MCHCVHCVCWQTTRNIQEGLPFSIQDVRRQTEDARLLAAVHDVADKYTTSLTSTTVQVTTARTALSTIYSCGTSSASSCSATFSGPPLPWTWRSKSSSERRKHQTAGSSFWWAITRPVLRVRLRLHWSRAITSCFSCTPNGQLLYTHMWHAVTSYLPVLMMAQNDICIKRSTLFASWWQKCYIRLSSNSVVL